MIGVPAGGTAAKDKGGAEDVDKKNEKKIWNAERSAVSGRWQSDPVHAFAIAHSRRRHRHAILAQ
jgi:hypothetical protein